MLDPVLKCPTGQLSSHQSNTSGEGNSLLLQAELSKIYFRKIPCAELKLFFLWHLPLYPALPLR